MFYLAHVKQKSIFYFCIFFTFFTFFSCRETPESLHAEQLDKPVSIVFDNSMYPQYDEMFRALIKDFNKQNKYKIKVTLLSSKNGCTKPDFIFLKAPLAKKLYKNNEVVDISDILGDPVYGLPNGSDFFIKAINKQIRYGLFKNEITSVPLFVDAHFLLYNKDSLATLGYKQIPRNWIGLNLLFCRSKKNLEKTIGVVYNFDNFYKIVEARGGSIFQPCKYNYSFNNPVVINTIRYLKVLESLKILYPNNLYSNQTDFAFGKLFMVITEISGVELYSNLIKAVNPNMNWDVELVTTRKPGDNIILTCNYNVVIMKGFPEREFASWLFIKWLLESEQQKRIVKGTKTLPADISLIPTLKKKEIGFSKQWFKALQLAYNSNKEAMTYLYDYYRVSAKFEETLRKIRKNGNIVFEIIKFEHQIKKQRKQDKYIREKAK